MTDFKKQWEQLNSIERSAIEKRYAGKSYPRIEEDLAEEFGADGFKLSTLKNIFAEGGRLFEIYYWYVEWTNKGRDREAQVFWRSMIMNAVAVVSEEMGEGRPNRLRAAQIVIESLWGKQLVPIEVKADITIRNKYMNKTPEELKERLAAIRAEKKRILAIAESKKAKEEGEQTN